jgi:hypothetical protein
MPPVRLLSRCATVLLVVGIGFATLASGACTDATPQPPPLGGCTATGDASCKEAIAGGGGGGSSRQGDGSTTEPDSSEALDSGPPVEGTDATFSADLMLAQYPGCESCVTAGQDAGSLSCLAQDMACSNDVGCLTILSCAVGCATGSSCLAQSCAGISLPASVTLYNDLVVCMGQACAAICPMLVTVTAGD